jgi:hypothetical protein
MNKLRLGKQDCRLQRSPAGAIAWYEAATQAIDDLRLNAQQHGFTFEGHRLRKPCSDRT